MKGCLGFSLVELMVALVVVMTLVALALPRYRVFVATSRQAEAQHNLGVIATLQQTYQLKHGGKYYNNSNFKMGRGFNYFNHECHDTINSKKNELGFRVSDCESLRYNYYIAGSWQAKNYSQPTSPRIYPGCNDSSHQARDVWEIDSEHELTHVNNVIKWCTD